MNWNDPVEVAGHAAAVAASESKSVRDASAQRDNHLAYAVLALYSNFALMRETIHELKDHPIFALNLANVRAELRRLGIAVDTLHSNVGKVHTPFVYADMTPVDSKPAALTAAEMDAKQETFAGTLEMVTATMNADPSDCDYHVDTVSGGGFQVVHTRTGEVVVYASDTNGFDLTYERAKQLALLMSAAAEFAAYEFNSGD